MRLSQSHLPGSCGNPFALGDADRTGEAWAPRVFDQVLFALPATEFRSLADGLRQRAVLLGSLLSDIFGEQRTVQNGALPLALLKANPKIALDDAPLVPSLQAYAADVLRGPDGAWCVAADHTGEAADASSFHGGPCLENAPAAVGLEAPAFTAILPSVCRVLLGQSLMLQTVPTLWFGDAGVLAKVAASYRRWAVRPAFDPAPDPVPLAGLSVVGRIALHEAVTADPCRFAACLAMPAAASPVLIRLFLIRDGVDWQVLPYCTARVLSPASAHPVQKNVWIVG